MPNKYNERVNRHHLLTRSFFRFTFVGKAIYYFISFFFLLQFCISFGANNTSVLYYFLYLFIICSRLFYLNLLFFVTHSVSPKKISPTGSRHIPRYGEVRGVLLMILYSITRKKSIDYRSLVNFLL